MNVFCAIYMTKREQHDKFMRHSTWGYRMEKMRIRLGYNAYYMRRWLRLLRRSWLSSSYPLPMSMLTPEGINRNSKEWSNNILYIFFRILYWILLWIYFSFMILMMKMKRHVIVVTWLVTWCDVIKSRRT